MKRLFSLGILLGFVYLLAGCSSLDQIDDIIGTGPTISGEVNIELDIGTEEPDWGSYINASDVVDGTIEIYPSMIDASNVNMDAVGTFDVIFTVPTSYGISSVYTLTVTIVDPSLPTIKLIGANTYTLAVFSEYVERGATAEDKDGNVLEYNINSSLDTSVVGVYIIEYVITGTSYTVTRTVNVIDNEAPIISLTGYSTDYVQLNSEFIDTEELLIEDNYYSEGFTVNSVSTVDTSVLGTYTVRYTVTDPSDNTSNTVTKQIIVIDQAFPIYVLDDEIITEIIDETIEYEDEYLLKDIWAIYGDVRYLLTTSDTVDNSTLGLYNINYTYVEEDSTTHTFSNTVSVLDTEAPVITLTGEAEVTIEVFDSYTELSALVVDNHDVDLVVVYDDGGLDTSVVGVYTLTYNITDSSSNVAVEVTRTVNVVDTEAPVIVLDGNDHLYVSLGNTFTDPSFTITDNYYTDGFVLNKVGTVTDAVGDYTLTYTYTDTSNNESNIISITVTVIDQVLPYIDLQGDSELFIEYPAEYTELGASIIFTYGKYDMTLSGSVTNGTLGDYQLDYSYNDGTTDYLATRIVHLEDTTPPVITLNGDSEITLEVFSTYTELSAVITDNYDTALGIIIDSTSIDMNTIGVYTVTYNITDTNSNVAIEVTRTVNVVDTEGPVIELIGNDHLYVSLGTSFIDPDFTITDNYYTEGFVLNVIGTVVDVEGDYTLVYTYTDPSNNVSNEISITVTVIDQVLPFIDLQGDSELFIEYPNEYSELGASVIFTYGRYDMTLVGEVVNSVLGDYQLDYSYNDGTTDYLATRIVHIEDTTPPVITLNGDSEITIEVFGEYIELSAVVTDNYDIDLEVEIDSSSLDVNVLGVYTITYTIADSNGNDAIVVTRTVNIVDTTPPEITLLGDVEYTINLNGDFTDLGVTGTDNYDPSIVLTQVGTVDVDVPGVYVITYFYTDQSGNVSEILTRTVTIVYTEPDFYNHQNGLTPNTIKGSFEFTDETSRVNNISLSLFIDDVLINEYIIYADGAWVDLSAEGAFSYLQVFENDENKITYEFIALADDSNYELVINYDYQDINNTKTDIVAHEREFMTMSTTLGVNIVDVLETAVFEDTDFSTVISLNNSYAAVVKSITIDGVVYDAFLPGTTTSLLIFYMNTLDYTGDTVFVIESMIVTYNNDDYYVEIIGEQVELYIIEEFNIYDMKFNDDIVELGNHNLMTLVFEKDPLLKIEEIYINGVMYEPESFDDVFTLDVYASFNDRYQVYTIDKIVYSYDGIEFEYTDDYDAMFFSATHINYIYTVADLVALSATCETVDCTGVFLLENDLDLTGITFNGLGTEDHPFAGLFDGQGYTISNYTVSEITDSTTVDTYGLFNYTDGALVTNLILDGFSINITNISTNETNEIFISPLVAYSNNSSFENIYILNAYINVTNTNDSFLGGLSGYAEASKFKDIYLELELISPTNALTFTGFLAGEINDCEYETIDIVSDSDYGLSTVQDSYFGVDVFQYDNTNDYTDQIKPIVTLVGASEIVVLVGQDYTEFGVVAVDNFDTSVTIEIIGTVDNNTIGEYILTYKVTDDAGNESYVLRRVSVSNEKVITGEGLGVFDSTVHGTDYFVVGSFVEIEEYGITSNGKSDGYIASYDTDFNLNWIVKIGGAEHEVIEKIVVQGDYIYVTGKTMSSIDYDFEGYTVKESVFITKLDLDGNIIWTKVFEGSDTEVITELVVTPTDIIYIGGVTASDDGSFVSSTTNYDKVFIFKLDSDGVLLDSIFYDTVGNDELKDMTFGINDNLYILVYGFTGDSTSSIIEYYMGTVLTTTDFDDVMLEEFYQNSDGTWYIAGITTYTPSIPVPYYFVRKLDVSLNLDYEQAMIYYIVGYKEAYINGDEVIFEGISDSGELVLITISTSETYTYEVIEQTSISNDEFIENVVIDGTYETDKEVFIGTYGYYNKISNEHLNGIYLRFE